MPRTEALPLAVSCGDPAGIGPELAVKARAALGARLPFAWIGDPRHLPADTLFTEIATIADATRVAPDRLPVLPLDIGPRPAPGRPDPALARGVVEAISTGVREVTTGNASALVTLPVSKQVLKQGAMFAFPGHTEYLAALSGAPRPVMMLVGRGLRVVPVTIHVPLSEVPARLTPELLEETLRVTHAGLRRDFAIRTPRLTVAGLNPHAGEGGTMGREEIEVLAPVLDRLRGEGMALSGPHPADTMFHPPARAGYDAAVCMYHDQALIPLKTLDFAGGVNVTLGLPFVRTSPDHGTAFDIAGTGVAQVTSTLAAMRLAARMAAARARK